MSYLGQIHLSSSEITQRLDEFTGKWRQSTHKQITKMYSDDAYMLSYGLLYYTVQIIHVYIFTNMSA